MSFDFFKYVCSENSGGGEKQYVHLSSTVQCNLYFDYVPMFNPLKKPTKKHNSIINYNIMIMTDLDTVHSTCLASGLL